MRIGNPGWIFVLALAAGCSSYVKRDERKTAPESLPDAGRALDAAQIEVTPAEGGKFDHAPFSTVLADFVSLEGAQSVLDYDRLAKNEAALESLKSYRAGLAAADPDSLEGEGQRLAFWLNAYNANVIAGVIDKRKASATFRVDADGFMFFKERVFTVAGVQMSLDELEQGVIRGDFKNAAVDGSPNETKVRAWHKSLWNGTTLNPRIHVALNCAALSCPNLQQKAWEPTTLSEDLQKALEAFLANPVKGAGPDGISLLFTFYRPDFELEGGSVSAFIEKNRVGGLTGVETKKALGYDWALNIKP